MANSTKSRRKNKSHQDAKPYDDFPLTVHPSGRWCKKHQGTQHYFGKIDDWEAALALYHHEWPYIIKGETPPPLVDDTQPDTQDDVCTLRKLCNSFLDDRRNHVQSGELSEHTFIAYHSTCKMLIDHFGHNQRVADLKPIDFGRFRAAIAADCNTVTLNSKINRCRIVLNFAFQNQMIDKPVAYGTQFDRPKKHILRKSKQSTGPRIFTAEEIRLILDALDGKPVPTSKTDDDENKVTVDNDPALKAMVLLGINCGFGNTDVASLPQTAIKDGWLEFPRPKTGIDRRIPLWPETAHALREAIAVRPAAKNAADNGLCFITSRGNRWAQMREGIKNGQRFSKSDAVGTKFTKLLKELGINGRYRLGFYTLRRCFETVGGSCRDQVAVDACMGHVDNSMAAEYRESIEDDRLQAVVDTVRAWLWPDADDAANDDDAVVVAGKVG